MWDTKDLEVDCIFVFNNSCSPVYTYIHMYVCLEKERLQYFNNGLFMPDQICGITWFRSRFDISSGIFSRKRRHMETKSYWLLVTSVSLCLLFLEKMPEEKSNLVLNLFDPTYLIRHKQPIVIIV